MTTCRYGESPAIELYFYGELPPDEHARVSGHIQGCAPCRRRLEDLTTIRATLARRPRVDAPESGDWSGFMSRLRAVTVETKPAPRAEVSVATRVSRPVAGWLALAATCVLVTMAVVMAARARHHPPVAAPPVATARATTAPAPSRAAAPPVSSRLAISDAGFTALSEQHFERSKLVVLGLATRNSRDTSAADWAYERRMAASLLSDTRLYRLAAEQRGRTDVARVMGDLETVLLETALSDHHDRDALERVQRLIRRRDLLVKMQAIGSPSGP